MGGHHRLAGAGHRVQHHLGHHGDEEDQTGSPLGSCHLVVPDPDREQAQQNRSSEHRYQGENGETSQCQAEKAPRHPAKLTAVGAVNVGHQAGHQHHRQHRAS